MLKEESLIFRKAFETAGGLATLACRRDWGGTTAAELVGQTDITALVEEGIDLLRRYLRIDTTNPPGDVAPAADFVEDVLHREGLPTTRLGPSPDKANVIATIGPDGGQPPLVLAHHMDVVPSVATDWSVDPFSGAVKDGFVWGRGTLDMKGFGVLSMLCGFVLGRLGAAESMRRPLRLLATADEEVGGALGAKWLADDHLHAAGGEFLLTEGSFARAGSRALYYPVVVAEKGVSTVTLTARGVPGHASAPSDDNAVVRIGRAIARLGDYRSPPGARDLGRRYLAGFPPAMLGLDGRRVADLSDDEMEVLMGRLSGSKRTQNMLRNTLTPTMVKAGVGQNVIPATAVAHVDCRSLPGVSADDILAEVAKVIDDASIDLAVVKSSIGTESPSDTELFHALEAAVKAERPEAVVVPFLTGGGTDSKHFRPRGVTCYGLTPFVLDDSEAAGIHGTNERVSIDNLEHGLRVMLGVVERMCLGTGAP